MESFRKTAGSEPYQFDVEMDSLGRLDMAMWVVMDCNARKFSKFASLPVHFTWVSPNGNVYEESASCGPENLKNDTFYSHVLFADYRKDVSVKEPGLWKLSITLPEDMIKMFGIRGVGFRYKDIEDGTR